MADVDRRVLGAAGAALLLLVAAVAVVFALRGSDVRPAPADEAARLVPAGALVFLHVSTDTGRDATRRALELAEGFPGFAEQRRSLVSRLSAPACKLDVGKLRGKEAALALIDAGGATAGSLVLIDTGDEAKAADRACGALQTTKLGRFLVIGQPQSIDAAKQLARGTGGGSLASNELYRRATDALPADRVADGWITAAGVRRLLRPQEGLLGAVGTLLDQPRLRAAALAVTAEDEQAAKLTIRTELRPGAGRSATATFPPFDPELADDVPDGALAYLGLRGLGGAATRLLAAAGPATAGLGPLLERAGEQLRSRSGGAAQRDVLDLFGGETAVVLLPRTPAPVLAVVAPTKDDAATRKALDALRAPLATVLKQPGRPTPRWTRKGEAWQLLPAPGIELDYAVADGKLIVSTSLEGISALREVETPITEGEEWKRARLPANPDRVSSLTFLDFRKLLALGEQTGLSQSAAYQQVKADLRRVRAVGASSTPGTDNTTTEILFSIP